jgi:hypothetical protein
MGEMQAGGGDICCWDTGAGIQADEISSKGFNLKLHSLVALLAVKTQIKGIARIVFDSAKAKIIAG